MSHIDSTDITDISKYTYLLSLLEGDAKSVVQGLAHTSANYQVACDLLKERYGRKEKIILSHVQALLNSYQVSSSSSGVKTVPQLWKLRDDILSHVRSLETLGVTGKQCEIFLTPIILGQLPRDLRLEWSREGDGHESDLEFLLKFLYKEINRLERSEEYGGDKTSTEGNKNNADGKKESKENSTTKEANKEKKFSTAALNTTSSSYKQGVSVCSFCSKNHTSEKCFAVLKLTGPERYEKIRSLGLCFKCLRSNHEARDCRSRIQCTSCGGHHNVLLCGVSVDYNSRNDYQTQKNYYKQDYQGYGKQHQYNGRQDYNYHRYRQEDYPPRRVDQAYQARQEEKQVTNSQGKTDNVSLFSGYNSTCTVLQTATVKVCTGDGRVVMAKVMFDNGADRSYISSGFVKKCKPQWLSSVSIPYSSFGGHGSGQEDHRNVFKLSLLDNKNKIVQVIVAEIPRICQPLIRPVVSSNVLKSFSHVDLADDYNNVSPLEIDILIGLDFYWNLITAEEAIQRGGLVALKSLFGYVLSGRLSESAANTRYTEPQLLSISPISESELCKFWDLETVGIKPKEVVQDSEMKVMQEFKNKVQFKDNRYVVALPWKDESFKEKLINNQKVAQKRLNRLQIQLDRDKELRKEYFKVFESYEDEGIVEEVPINEIASSYPIYYMPHRPVVRLTSSSTKVRPVFDASASCLNGVSLNDCLYSGPSLNPDLVEVLVRFRRWPIAITADIKQAFLQISVCKEDKDVHRFLLPTEEGTIRHMRFNRVPFGNTASPFLLNATIKVHLEKYPKSTVVQELKTDMYTDNWISGADSPQEAQMKFCEARSILSDCSMDLTKLVSNYTITSNLQNDVYYIQEGNESSSVLGLNWCTVQDIFSFGCLKSDENVEIAPTKRSVLSVIAKMFDPMGYLSPYVMSLKILFQDIWKLKLEWDEELPLELKIRFKKWIQSRLSLNAFHMDRCYFPGMCWKDIKDIELHGFGDASEKGYGACVYLRIPVENGSYKVSLVMSKSRVAPIKVVTLPRLELLGALLCCRLVEFVRNALYLDNAKAKVTCWTDSTIALSWIKGDSSKKDVFINNRVREINKFIPKDCWKHCPSKENPADLITRGVLADKLVQDSQWLCGPPMLSSALSCEKDKGETQGLDLEVPYSTTTNAACLSVTSHYPLIHLDKFSDLHKALRVTAYVLRFLNNCRKKNTQGPITVEELNVAKFKIISNIQHKEFENEIKLLSNNKALPLNSKLRTLDPFLDGKGLLRIKGRLEYSELDYDMKHPIIIPKGKFAKLLIQFQHEYLKHAGVNTVISSLRTQFWITHIRKLAKAVVKDCLICRWLDSRPCSQPVAPLPKERITTARPFSVTGLDHAGPLFCADFPGKKFYVLLFTCGVVRAVHLELTESLSLSDCMLAIRKFVARRGNPDVFFSDNAKTFTAAKSEVVKVYGHLAPKWKFIVPRSPWWGGWWERLIRSVKFALRKTLGLKYMSVSEMETVLVEIEGCINSRPLTFVGEDPDPLNYLTPSHFILGCNPNSKSSIDIVPCNVSAKDLNEREILKNAKLDHFWKIWSTNYITNLPNVVKGFTQKCKLAKGDLVLIKEDNVPRLKWPIGVVVDMFPGHDGIVRSIRVRTKKGELTRPIQRAYDLEIRKHESMVGPEAMNSIDDVSGNDILPEVDLSDVSNDDPSNINDVHSNTVVSDVPTVTRTGRVIKAPKKLDL